MRAMYRTQSLNWFERSARTAFYRNGMKASERIGELAGIIAAILVVMFFVAHQLWSTGFFTSEFGNFEIVLFYSALSIGMVTSATRALLGKRNETRPLEIAGSALAAVFCFWFYTIFPFNFAHFGDVVPLSLGFLISWIPWLLAKILLLIGGVGATVGAVYDTALFFRVRAMLRTSETGADVKKVRTQYHE